LGSFLIVAPFAVIAWRARWLTFDGAIAAWTVGSLVLAFGGLWSASALVIFFASGTALTLVGRQAKMQPEHRGRGRDAVQVLCTGGAGTLAMVAAGLAPDPGTAAVYRAAFLGSIAAATADTWATEIGTLSRAAPRMITTWKPAPAGTSGAISPAGTASGVIGASVIAGLAMVATPPINAAAIVVAGVAGMLFDSVLGATVQAVFARPDGTVTESAERDARLTRGVWWMTNPVVNAAATAAGAVIAAAAQSLR